MSTTTNSPGRDQDEHEPLVVQADDPAPTPTSRVERSPVAPVILCMSGLFGASMAVLSAHITDYSIAGPMFIGVSIRALPLLFPSRNISHKTALLLLSFEPGVMALACWLTGGRFLYTSTSSLMLQIIACVMAPLGIAIDVQIHVRGETAQRTVKAIWLVCHLLLTPAYADATGGSSPSELLLMLWAALWTGVVFGELIGRDAYGRAIFEVLVQEQLSRSVSQIDAQTSPGLAHTRAPAPSPVQWTPSSAQTPSPANPHPTVPARGVRRDNLIMLANTAPSALVDSFAAHSKYRTYTFVKQLYGGHQGSSISLLASPDGSDMVVCKLRHW
jgi:hypothetical protein